MNGHLAGRNENAALNQIQNIDVKLGDASLLGGEKFDFIFANIQRNILLQDLPAYASVLNKKGLIAMSGFYIEDLPAIIAKAREQGLTDAGNKQQNKWVAALFRKD